jgi:hypothetical protein
MYTLPSNAVASLIYFSQYVSTARDIVVAFDYACYGASINGGEGFCVFFGDTFSPVIVGGGPGPGLCYSAVSGINADADIKLFGLNSGIIGIGFDITGNFGSKNYFQSGYNDSVTNSIALRANHEAGYNIVTRTSNLNTNTTKPISIYQQLTSGQMPDYKRVRVRLTDFGKRVVVDIKSVNDANFTNYLDYNITSYNNSLSTSTTLSSTPISWPTTVRCGLGFSTGESSNTTFKIKSFNINGVISLSAAPGTYTYDVDTTTLSATFAYTNPAVPNLVQYDLLSARNVEIYGPLNQKVRNQTVLLDPANPLVVVSPSAGPLGVPYTPGDNYVRITDTTNK